MKKFLCFLMITIFLTSTTVCSVSSVDYTDITPTIMFSSDKEYYSHTDIFDTDENLQYRANCYGFAMRLFYRGSAIPYGVTGSLSVAGYFQFPGEFQDRSVSGKTYADLRQQYNNGISGMSVLSNVIKDCSTLGYTVETVVANPDSSYIPAAANPSSGKRLVALVLGDGDAHFYVQNSNLGIWTHKRGNTPAISTCYVHDAVTLTNQNICEHMYCDSYDEFGILFYVTAPGTPDISHASGLASNSYQTRLANYDSAGSSDVCAQPLPDISSFTKTGLIDYVGDVDCYIFNVTDTKTYDIEFYKDTDYPLTVHIGEVVGSVGGTVSFTTYTVSATSSRLWFSRSLSAGKRYMIRIQSIGLNGYDNNRYYLMTIQ